MTVVAFFYNQQSITRDPYIQNALLRVVMTYHLELEAGILVASQKLSKQWSVRHIHIIHHGLTSVYDLTLRPSPVHNLSILTTGMCCLSVDL